MISSPLREVMEDIGSVVGEHKHFNKKLCFSNIRSLLANNDNVKIGQIEKSAGLRAGYMSRLEKDDNQSEPAIEFVVTAAKSLNVSLDLLISVDLSAQTEADMYLLRLLDKLKLDTINNRLKWELEPVNVLNGFEPADIDERPPHNLFVDSVIDEEGTITRRFVFNSNAFGKHTIITDNCYNLRLKNGKYLYLMNVGDKSYLLNDKSAKAREIWICGHNDVPQYVVGNRESETLSLAVDKLFDVVQSRITRPRLTDDAIHSLDAFMNDDLTDDPLYGFSEGDIPF